MRLIPDEVWGTLTVWMEARGEPYEGKVAVAEVIQRRAVRKFMSDGTIVGTVLKAYQFSGFNTSDPNRLAAARLDDSDPVYQKCLAAWRDALGGVSVVPAAVFYFSPAGVDHTPTWASTDKLVKSIGAHQFYAA
jgi:spore germination cell wall hydrolase CwlJ-like protein